MRTDVKIGLLCVFAIVLATVIYFVVAQQSRGPQPAQAGNLPANTGEGLASPRTTGTTGDATPAPGGLQVAPPIGSESHGLEVAPAAPQSPTPGVIGQSIAQASPAGNGMGGGMISPPPSPGSPITPSMGGGLASPSTQPGSTAPPLSGGQPITPGKTLIPSTTPSESTLMGGSGGSVETPRRETPGSLGGSMGGSSAYGSNYGGGMGGGLGSPSLLGSAASAGGTTHTIEKGDTFGSLAKKYGVTIKAITAANPGVSSNNLTIGKKVNIPAASATPAVSSASGDASAASLAKPAKPAKPAAATRPSRRPAGTSAAAAKPAAGTGKPGSTYTVKKGDTLGKIAASVYGDKAAWKKIYDANRSEIANADVLSIGQVLHLP